MSLSSNLDPNKINTTAWHNILVHQLSPDELRDVCFDVGLDYENLLGDNHHLKARSLINYFSRQRRLLVLLDGCQNVRPDIDWVAELTTEPTRQKSKTEESRSTKPKNIRPTVNQVDEPKMEPTPQKSKTEESRSTKSKNVRSGTDPTDEPKMGSTWRRTKSSTKSDKQGYPLPEVSKTLLHLMRQQFNLVDLKEIALDTGVNFDTLRANTVNNGSIELLMYFHRHGRLAELVEVCRLKRPSIEWPEVETKMSQPPDDGYKTAAMRHLLIHIFEDDEGLVEFCQAHFPQVVFEFGSGMSFREKVYALLVYCRRNQLFDQLLNVIEANYPESFVEYGPYKVDD
jgi:hypothetical protein